MKRIAIWSGVAILIVVVAVAIALPSFLKARNTSCSNACINNLRQIDSGKEQAALANKWTPDIDCDLPENMAMVNQYIKGNQTPVCPKGGKYQYGLLKETPACNFYNPKDRTTFSHSMDYGRTR